MLKEVVRRKVNVYAKQAVLHFQLPNLVGLLFEECRALYTKLCGSSPARSTCRKLATTLTCRFTGLDAGTQRVYAASVPPAGLVRCPDGPTTCHDAFVSHAYYALLAKTAFVQHTALAQQSKVSCILHVLCFSRCRDLRSSAIASQLVEGGGW